MSVQLSTAAPKRKVFASVDPNAIHHQRPNVNDNNKTSASSHPLKVPQVSYPPLPQQASTRFSEVLGIQETPQMLLTQESLAMDWKDAQKSLDHLFEDCLKAQFKGVPKLAMPSIFRANGVSLFGHQVDGIRWLTHREKTNTTPAPYYSERKFGSKILWSDKIQAGRVNHEEKPEPVKGSILADEMGLGKTLQTIGLILSSRPTGVRSYPIKRDMPDTPRCTLIVAPVSVMANWAQEFKKFVNTDAQGEVLKIAFYQGYKRHTTLAQVQAGSLDVLIASYETVAADLKKAQHFGKQQDGDHQQDSGSDDEEAEAITEVRHDTIFDVLFHRLVLDEAHIIRNSSTKASRACKRVQSVHKLCLTGTPFINNPTDIQSLFSFMEVKPLDDKSVFKYFILEPILERKEIGLSKLRLALASLCLRRTKDGVGETVTMVPKSVELRTIGFTGPHKEVHDKLYDVCRKGYLALLCAGAEAFRKQAFSLFGLMMRIRQSCCSSHLVTEADCQAIDMVWEEFNTVDLDLLDAESGVELFERLVAALRARRGNNTIDTGGESHEAIAKRPRMELGTAPKIIPRNLAGRHPKIMALMDAIHKIPAGEKGVIYSQWTTYLDVIQSDLIRDGIVWTRLDGSMDAAARLRAMESFAGTDNSSNNSAKQQQEPTIMLCSLKAAGTGINLTRANHVFMMDCWWNVAQEHQAMDRIHRIGQTRPVHAIRFVMADSIEERVLRVQEAKQTLGKGVLKRLQKEERNKAKVTALRDLFEMDQHKFVDWEGVFEDGDDDDDDGLKELIMGDDHAL